jgi:hypothetical protein
MRVRMEAPQSLPNRDEGDTVKKVDVEGGKIWVKANRTVDEVEDAAL